MKQSESKFKIFCIVGTRPEFIKMFPVYKLLWERASENRSGKEIEVKWISSSQHNEMLNDLEEFFKVKPDYYFELLSKPNKKLGELSAEIMQQATKLFTEERPDLIFIQGDTLTALECGLAAFYEKIPVAHVEAGIRTNNILAPFPEELSRRILSQFSDLNFAPGQRSLNTLEAEKILFKKKSYNFYTGNTVIDALDFSCKRIADAGFDWNLFKMAELSFQKKQIDLLQYLIQSSFKRRILVTAHRRENFGEALENLTKAIQRIAEKFNGTNEVEFIICIHKNPNAREVFQKLYDRVELDKLTNITILEPLNYPLFIKLMTHSYFIITDSGGIQEEAPYLSKPVLVFRNETERTEGIDFGFSKLIGTEEHLIHGAALEMLQDESIYNSMIKKDLQPYGDGLAASRIVDISMLYLKQGGATT